MGSHFFLHTSNRTEALLDTLVAVLDALELGPFDRVPFLVQGRGMERWLQMRLSERYGVWANSDFLFPQHFFAQLAERLGVALNEEAFSRERLQWLIHHHLLADPPEALRAQLSGEGSAGRRFQLAGELANLFDQYQLSRPDWLSDWAEGRVTPQDEAAKWQMALWRKLLPDLGGTHRGEAWQALMEAIETADVARLPKVVFVFGIGFMPALMLDVLHALSGKVDVHFFTLSPTPLYWGDARRRLQWQADGEVEAPQDWHHPLLNAWGTQGAHFQNLLYRDSVSIGMESAPYHPPAPESLLRHLQRDLLEDALTPVAEGVKEDIRFHRVHTPLREVEVARQVIEGALRDDPDLRLDQIVVMAPDIGLYRPFIEEVFADLPHHVADRQLATTHPVLESLSQFLSLVQGRLGWDEVVSFLAREDVLKALGLDEAAVERLESWIHEAQIRCDWTDAHHRNGWLEGLERLLLGMMMSPDGLWQGRAAVETDALSGQGMTALDALLRLIGLLRRWRQWAGAPATLDVWAARLNQWLAQLYGEADAEQTPLREAIARLEALAPAHPEPVELAVLGQWLAALKEERRTSAGFLAGGITFCDLLPMRAIPMEVVVVMGMADRAYPRPVYPRAFDLIARHPRLGDRQVRAEDRHTFLELLLSVRARLEIIWQGLSEDTNQPKAPAQVVLELQDTLERMGVAVDALTLSHPMRPYHPRYFEGQGALQSFSQRDWEIATHLAEPRAAAPLCPPGWQPPAEAMPVWTLEVLLRVLKRPHEAFLGRFGHLPPLEAPPPASPRVSLGNRLAQWQLKRLLFEAGEAAVVERGWVPRGEVGEHLVAQASADVAALKAAVAELGAALEPARVHLALPGATLVGELDGLHEQGQALVHFGEGIKASDMLSAMIRHLVAVAAGVAERTWVFWLEKGQVRSRLLGPLSADPLRLLSDWVEEANAVLDGPALWHPEALKHLWHDREEGEPFEQFVAVMERMVAGASRYYIDEAAQRLLGGLSVEQDQWRDCWARLAPKVQALAEGMAR